MNCLVLLCSIYLNGYMGHAFLKTNAPEKSSDFVGGYSIELDFDETPFSIELAHDSNVDMGIPFESRRYGEYSINYIKFNYRKKLL